MTDPLEQQLAPSRWTLTEHRANGNKVIESYDEDPIEATGLIERARVLAIIEARRPLAVRLGFTAALDDLLASIRGREHGLQPSTLGSESCERSPSESTVGHETGKSSPSTPSSRASCSPTASMTTPSPRSTAPSGNAPTAPGASTAPSSTLDSTEGRLPNRVCPGYEADIHEPFGCVHCYRSQKDHEGTLKECRCIKADTDDGVHNADCPRRREGRLSDITPVPPGAYYVQTPFGWATPNVEPRSGVCRNGRHALCSEDPEGDCACPCHAARQDGLARCPHNEPVDTCTMCQRAQRFDEAEAEHGLSANTDPNRVEVCDHTQMSTSVDNKTPIAHESEQGEHLTDQSDTPETDPK